MSTIRFPDAVDALVDAYQDAAGLAGIPVYDGPQVTSAADADYIIVGHDASMGSDGTLQPSALAGNYLQEWADMTTGRDERGYVNCVIVSQTGDATDVSGRRDRVKVLMAAAEDAAVTGGAANLTFDGTSDGRFITRQASNGVVVMCAYRVTYSAPWTA